MGESIAKTESNAGQVYPAEPQILLLSDSRNIQQRIRRTVIVGHFQSHVPVGLYRRSEDDAHRATASARDHLPAACICREAEVTRVCAANGHGSDGRRARSEYIYGHGLRTAARTELHDSECQRRRTELNGG